MSVVWEYRSLFVSGAITTLELTLVSSVAMLVVSIGVGLMRLSTVGPIRWTAAAYVEVFRGTSLYVQLFWFYFALPLLGIRIEATTVAWIGLALCIGAYGSEVVRAAILAIPRDQIEAGVALSLSPAQRLRVVILPQALRASIPPFGNLCIELLKGTSLVALITVPDLTFQARLVSGRTLDTLACFGITLIVYFAISQLISAIFGHLEARYAFDRRARA